MKALAAGLVRALVLAVIPSVLLHIYDTRFYDGIGADIGGALLLFQVIVLGAFLWSWFDARRRPLRAAGAVWAWTGVACFAAGALEWTIVGDLDGLRPALESGVWNVVLVGVGAGGGLTLGWALNRRSAR